MQIRTPVLAAAWRPHHTVKGHEVAEDDLHRVLLMGLVVSAES